jgi:hypothetical protein
LAWAQFALYCQIISSLNRGSSAVKRGSSLILREVAMVCGAWFWSLACGARKGCLLVAGVRFDGLLLAWFWRRGGQGSGRVYRCSAAALGGQPFDDSH